MLITCPLSSIEFGAEFFQKTSYSSKETIHPIFNLPQKTLLSLLSPWAKGDLSDIESYLLYLALLKSSKLLRFKSPARPTEKTRGVIYHNMEHLAKVLLDLNSVQNIEEIFPVISINKDTADLYNSKAWIDVWKDAHQKWVSGYKFAADFRELDRRKMAVQRLIKSPHISPEKYASQLASWAAMAGDFPENTISHPKTKLPVTLSEYWQEIIRTCGVKSKVFSLRTEHIERLQEYCEEHIEIGTSQARALFNLLESALETHRNFLGIEEIGPTSFTILSPDETKESIGAKNLKAIVLSAPEKEPEEKDFVKKIDYIRAKFAWEMSKKTKKD